MKEKRRMKGIKTERNLLKLREESNKKKKYNFKNAISKETAVSISAKSHSIETIK